MAELSDIRGIKHFDTSADASTVSVKWESWFEESNAYATVRHCLLRGKKVRLELN